MGIIIFWSVIALSYLALAIYTLKALQTFNANLGELKKMSPTGIINKKGEVRAVETELYNAIKAILVTGIIGCSFAATAAIGSFIITA